jgi:hypothetical protein
MKTRKVIIIFFLLVAVGGMVVFASLNKKDEKILVNQESERDSDIAVIRNLSGNQDVKIEFIEAGKSSNGLNVPVNIYYSDADQYEINTEGKIVEFRLRDLPIGSENEKVIDNNPRYSQQDLESMARQFIIKNAPEVNLEKLILDQNIKENGKIKNYFFRWEDRGRKTTEGYPFVQLGFSQGGTLLNYINTL